MWEELFKAGELANATYSIAEDENVFHKWESEMTKAYHELKTNGKNLAKINNKRLKKNSVDFKVFSIHFLVANFFRRSNQTSAKTGQRR
jgi:ribosomal 50S subunit-associated protein YjgA (DUF615 family)